MQDVRPAHDLVVLRCPRCSDPFLSLERVIEDDETSLALAELVCANCDHGVCRWVSARDVDDLQLAFERSVGAIAQALAGGVPDRLPAL